MYAKLLIKIAILVLVINVALAGIISHRGSRLVVALFNLIAIFVVLFQEREVFQTTPPSSKRILFTTDVFAWISIGIGIILAWCSRYWFPEFPSLLMGILCGGLFYLLTVGFFNLTSEDYWGDGSVRVIGTVVILILLGMIAQMMWFVSLQWLNNTYEKATMRRQNTLQSIVVDKEIVMPTPSKNTDWAEVGTWSMADTGSVGEDNWDANNNDEIVWEPGDGDWDNTNNSWERIFSSSVRAQQGALTYGTFLPVLFSTYHIPASTNNYTFTYVPSSSSVYPSFVLARDYTMIGTATHPESQLTCQTMMVLLWLIEKWDLSYNSDTVLDVFRNEAVKRGRTQYGCEERGATATWADLP